MDQLDPLVVFILQYIIPAICAAAVLYLTWLARKEGKKEREMERLATILPVAEVIKIENMPPYADDQQLTKIIVLNKGKCVMERPATRVICPWGGDIGGIVLDWGKDNSLAPGEQKIFNIRLPDPPKGEYEIEIEIIAVNPISKMPIGWTHKEKIKV